MKNLLIYTSKIHDFNEETKILIKIQIDNAIEFGAAEDVILVTNFEYEYRGVRSLNIPDIVYEPDPTSTKPPVIVYLLKNELLPLETIWCHDFDAFQDDEVDVEVSNLALVSYGYKKQWNFGSFFFKPSDKILKSFELLVERMNGRKNRADEKTLIELTSSGEISDFVEFGLEYNYTQAVYEFRKFDHIKPKVLHFHPNYKFYRAKETNLNIFMYGKSRLNRVLMSERLIKIFNKHGVV